MAKNYTPEGLLERFDNWEQELDGHWRKWRKKADTCYDLVGGRMWSKDEEEYREDTTRASPSFNRAGVMVDAIVGAQLSNRQEVRAYPRQINDSGAGEAATNALSWVRDEADVEDEESFAFYDTLTSGVGVIDTRIDLDDPDDDPRSGGTIRPEAQDPRDYQVDPRSQKPNFVDRRYQRRKLTFALDVAQDKWPNADLSASGGDEQNMTFTVRKYVEDYEDELSATVGDDDVVVWEWQWWDKAPVIFLADPATNELVELSKEQFDAISESFAEFGMEQPRHETIMRRCYYRAYQLHAGSILPSPETGELVEKLDANWFTTTFITGKLDRSEGLMYGVVSALIDPSRWANMLYATIVDVLNHQSKGGVPFIEESAVDDIEEFQDQVADPTAPKVLADGALAAGKLMFPPASPYPAGYHNLMEVAVGAIKEVAGVNEEMLGLVGRDQPGVLEQQRIRSAYGVLSVYFNNLRRYRKEWSRLCLKMLRKLDPNTLIRVDDELGPKYVPMMLDPSVQRYDIKIDESPMSPNQKAKVTNAIAQLMPLLQNAQLPPSFWAEVAKHIDLPESLSAKLQETLTKPNPQQQAAQQLQMRKAQADVSKIEADAQLSQAKARSEMQGDPGDAIKLQHAQMQMAADQQENAVDAEMQSFDLIMKREELRDRREQRAHDRWMELKRAEEAERQSRLQSINGGLQ